MTRFRPLFAVFVLAVTLGFLFLPASPVSADEGWVIRTFNSSYVVHEDASVDVVEDIQVDFLGLEKHGIFRNIPVEYQIEGDPRHHRLITLSNIKVDDGNGKSWKFERSRVGDDVQLKIGDSGKTISGPQHYRISYTVKGAFNTFDDHDEFYWNATGDEWPVPIQSADATLTAPALQQIVCFEGVRASTRTCNSNLSGSSATFSTGALDSGEGLTIVAGLPKGAVTVPPPTLKYIKTPTEAFVDFMGIKPLPIIGAIILGIAAIGLVIRNWWLSGRDRWAGDVHYLTGSSENNPKPLFARETVVVEYTPPEIGTEKRPLRPAEIGLLLDERADTLDVTATIVDLGVRKYLKIEEIEGKGLFGKDDYQLTKLKDADDELLVYEKTLHQALFDSGDTVKLSDLKNTFYSDLSKVKDALYVQGGKTRDRFFNRNPNSVRTGYLTGGLFLAGLGLAAFVGLGVIEAGAILALPIIVAGLLMAAFSSAMVARTAFGRETYRRTLGFREYMEVAETDRQRFYEDVSIFDKYLPYAIVYGCTEKWARAFEGIEGMDSTDRGWYVSSRAFTPVLFASTVNSFSSSVSSSIASVPASSGGSGFSGGGGGGGGFGGGGGGSW